MSTASLVPETIGLDGERAIATIKRVKILPLARDSFSRLRWADGFSHSRALAFQLVLTVVPGAIVLVAVAGELRWESLSNSIIQLTSSLAPGPAGEVFADAIRQGAQASNQHHAAVPIIVGSIAFMISGATSFGQIERAANRIYGVEADRPALRKYGVGTLLMLSAGTFTAASLLIIGLGEEWLHGTVGEIWEAARWVLGGGLLTLAVALVFQICPRRRQPELSWLAFGGLIGVTGAVVVTALLRLYLDASSGFGETYGPLAGFIGVMLWTYLGSIMLLFGLAVAAQLEAVRAGVPDPRSPAKVHESDPPSAPTHLPGEPEVNPEPPEPTPAASSEPR